MRRLAIAVIGIALLTPATGLGQTDAGRTDAEVEKMMADFSRRTESDSLIIQAVHMNDITTDELFEAPAKYSLRAQARGATMFFVSGTVKEDGYAVDMDWRVILGASRSVRAQTVSISNFEGEPLQAGDTFSGIVALEESINMREKFTLTNLNWRFEFIFTSSVLSQLETTGAN